MHQTYTEAAILQRMERESTDHEFRRTSSRVLTDSEIAVIIDSLAAMRRGLREQDFPTPNIDSALEKIESLVEPSTYALILSDPT